MFTTLNNQPADNTIYPVENIEWNKQNTVVVQKLRMK